MFVWDENKRQANIAKHGFDFIHADQVLCEPHIALKSNYSGDEVRFLAVGMIENRIATVVYTMRGEQYRIISIRSARDEERRAFKELLG